MEQNQFQSQLVHALCDSVQNCCTAAERGFDSVHCRQSVIQQFVVPLSDTTLLYDPAQAGRCVQAVNQAAQACQSVDVTTCYDAFIGNIPVGGACRSSFECDPGPNGFAICGSDNTCTQPSRGQPGQPCSYSCIEQGGMPRCHSIFYGAAAGNASACHSADNLVCVANQTGGATCQGLTSDCKQNPQGSCPAPQECDMTSGQCFTPVPIGGPCTPGQCGTAGYCAAGVCYAVKPNAAVCGQDVECASGKCDRGFCVEYSQAAMTWCGASTVE